MRLQGAGGEGKEIKECVALHSRTSPIKMGEKKGNLYFGGSISGSTSGLRILKKPSFSASIPSLNYTQFSTQEAPLFSVPAPPKSLLL